VFDEAVYPFAKLNPNADTRLRFSILLLPSSSETLDTSSPGVQIIDSSTIDAHNFSVPANASGPAVATGENSASFDAGTSLEFVLQVSNGGCGLDTNPKGDSLARTFSGEGANSHNDIVGGLSAIDSSFLANPRGRVREVVRGGHVGDGVRLPGSSATNAAASGSPLAPAESPTTTDPVGSDFTPAQFSSPVASDPVSVVSSL
jgi:hypothetical protein